MRATVVLPDAGDEPRRHALNPSFPALLPVPEHAEFTHHGSLGPTAGLRLVTYGRQVIVVRVPARCFLRKVLAAENPDVTVARPGGAAAP